MLMKLLFYEECYYKMYLRHWKVRYLEMEQDIEMEIGLWFNQV